jgi:hypothetical protein
MKILKNYFDKPGLFGLLLAIYLINPFNLGFLLGYTIFALLIIKGEFLKNNIDFDVILLTTFSFIYAAFYALNLEFGLQFILIYAVFPPTFYLLGKYLCTKVESEETLFISLFFVGFLLSFSGLISILLSINEGGFGQIERSLPLFWENRIVSATVMGSFFPLNMSIPALLVVRQIKLSLILRIFMITVFILSLLCILRIGTRTQIVISLFTLLFALIYSIPRQSLKKNIIIFSIFSIGIVFIIQNVTFDLNSDFLSAFADRMENNGGSDIASGGGRSSRWVKSFENLFTKPLGWSVKEFGHSHNMWLDVLRASGVIPFLLLVIFTIRSVIKIKRVSNLNKEMLSFFNQIRVYALALFLLFMVEPIFEGMFSTFVLFCFLMGVITTFEKRYLITRSNTTEKTS